MTARLGQPDARQLHESDAHGSVLLPRLPGGRRRSRGRPRALRHRLGRGHAVAERPAAVDGDRVRGPGIFDMKTGLAQGIWALKLAPESARLLPTVTFLLQFNG